MSFNCSFLFFLVHFPIHSALSVPIIPLNVKNLPLQVPLSPLFLVSPHQKISGYWIDVLDRKSGRDVVEIMQRLAKEQGCTILLVTHDNRILDIANRIIYMEDGRLVRKSDSVAVWLVTHHFKKLRARHKCQKSNAGNPLLSRVQFRQKRKLDTSQVLQLFCSNLEVSNRDASSLKIMTTHNPVEWNGKRRRTDTISGL